MRLDEAIDEQRFKCTWYMRDLVIAAAASVRVVLEAVQEAMQRYGKPEIFNTDQCSQFTSIEFTRLLKVLPSAWTIKAAGATTYSWNGCGNRSSNEEVYLRTYETMSAARSGIGRYLDFYNAAGHSALDGSMPDAFYYRRLAALEQAA